MLSWNLGIDALPAVPELNVLLHYITILPTEQQQTDKQG